MTDKLFYRDASLISFDAAVLSCTPEQDYYWLELDRTAFFPEEGGQYADTGTLNGEPVLDVQMKQDTIYHKVARALPPHTAVSAAVDWKNRFDNMQQHTGEHILSGLVHRRFGYDNVGFHLGRETVTLDFNGILTLEELRTIERQANEAVAANLEVLVSFPSPQALSGMDYRSKLELHDNVRIVEIPGFDICACCAPHVTRTGEIGLIKICGVMKHRGGVRVNMLCGMRALSDYNQKADSVSSISVQLSAKPENTAAAVARLKSENESLHSRLSKMQSLLLQYKIDALSYEQPHLLLFEADLDTASMRRAVNSLTKRCNGYCGIFSGNEAQGYQYIIGSSCLDCREAAKQLREAFGSKGGGSALMVQGSLTASETAIRKLFTC